MLDWIRRLIVGDNQRPVADAYDQREQVVVERLASIRKQSPDEVRAAARRRALMIEVESIRRDS